MADASVLGSSSRRKPWSRSPVGTRPPCGQVWRNCCAARCSKVSADRLSPERGSYRFAQNLLGKVAYETLSRRDRKARHLAVAAHLRATFAGDGDEVIDAVAHHYQDALAAVPDDPDTAQIRSEAVAALIRGAQRAQRSGSPRSASANYTAAARLIDEPRRTTPHRGPMRHRPLGAPSAEAAALWESAAEADLLAGDYEAALDHADRAAAGHDAAGRLRDAARAGALAGRALSLEGRKAEARERLTAAVRVLRSEPDRDTVRALSYLANNAASSGHADADSLTSEALRLGQALQVDGGLLARLFSMRGVYLATANRQEEALAHYEYSVRIAERSGDSDGAALALINLSDVLLCVDPRAAADAARTACEHCRRVGARASLGIAALNLSTALILAGDWDGAQAALTAAADTEGIDEHSAARATLAALRGDLASAHQWAALPRMRASEDPQDRATVEAVDTLIAAAQGDAAGTLAHAREVLAVVPALGVRAEWVAFAWSPAVRAARTLGDTDTVVELLAVLEPFPAGQLTPLLRAELDLARARRAGDTGDPGAEESLATAVAALRRFASPYHLAHALLDQAEFLVTTGKPDRAEAAVTEARPLAAALSAAPVVDRADQISRALAIDVAIESAVS